MIDIGFFIARVMHFYGMTYWEVYDTPIRVFWMLTRNTDRIRAENELRVLHNRIAGQGAGREGIEAYQRALQAEIGAVVV